MSIRWSKNWNDVLKDRMDAFSQSLESNFSVTTKLHHPGMKWDIRAKAIADELKLNLPGTFEIAFNCNAIDYSWRLSWELDIVIYNKLLNNPLFWNRDDNNKNIILPIESILAIIEVKTLLNSTEHQNIAKGIEEIYKLKPWKKKFIPWDTKGEDKSYRIFYTVFAFDSDLVDWADWIKNEFNRIKSWEKIDRVILPNRWIINPQHKKGRKIKSTDPKWTIILEWYIHLINFIVREDKRRDPVDWQNYMSTFGRLWENL